MFDMCNRWFAFVQIMSWMRLLLRKYALELESKKDAGGMGHAMVPTPAFRTSSFVLPMRVCLPPPSFFPSVFLLPLWRGLCVEDVFVWLFHLVSVSCVERVDISGFYGQSVMYVVF